MRISDWSSDVCSSDLDDAERGISARRAAAKAEVMSDTGDCIPPSGDGPAVQDFHIRRLGGSARPLALAAEPKPVQIRADPGFRFPSHEIGRASCRESGGKYV